MSDKKYLELIKDPESNEKELRGMVESEARKNGYNSPIVYHGTNKKFNKFEKGFLGSGDNIGFLGNGFYFTNDYETAKTYADSDVGSVLDFYIKLKNPYISDNWEHTSPFKEGSFARDLGIERGGETGHLKKMGHDGVISTDTEEFEATGDDYTEYVVYSPNQIKSADLITYDDNGDVIPLSKRFDDDSDDIRESFSKHGLNKLYSVIKEINSVINENYNRVHPRDLFNESMLLKSVGRLSLLITNGESPEGLEMDEESDGFDVRQNDDGDIFINNIEIRIHGVPHFFGTPMNSRKNYPLFCQTEDWDVYEVFDTSGNFKQEFLDYVEGGVVEESKKKWSTECGGKRVKHGHKDYKIAPDTCKGVAYCTRSKGIKDKGKCSPNQLSRKKWKCRGKCSGNTCPSNCDGRKRIKESIGGTHISVDVQPDYMDGIHFDVGEYYQWMYDNFDKVIVYINGEELGFQSSKEHKQWLLWEQDVPEEIINSFIFREKGYAFFRSCMDSGYEDCLSELIEYMYKNEITDSRDLEESDFNKLKELYDHCDDIIDFIESSGEMISIPDLMYELDNEGLRNVTLSGGGDRECLEEIRLALTALGIKHMDVDKYVY